MLNMIEPATSIANLVFAVLGSILIAIQISNQIKIKPSTKQTRVRLVIAILFVCQGLLIVSLLVLLTVTDSLGIPLILFAVSFVFSCITFALIDAPIRRFEVSLLIIVGTLVSAFSGLYFVLFVAQKLTALR